MEWPARHRRDPVWELAAGASARDLPLLRAGRPPFVLTPDSAASYFELSSELRSIDKGAPGAFFPLAGIAHRLAALLTRHADSRYLRS